jgi:hypothetical protein
MGLPKMPHCAFKFETDTGSVTTTADSVHEGPGQVEFQFENTKSQTFNFDYFRGECVVGLADVPHVGLLLRHENGFLSLVVSEDTIAMASMSHEHTCWMAASSRGCLVSRLPLSLMVHM